MQPMNERASAAQFFAPTLEILERAFRVLEARVDPPIRKAWKNGFVFRYEDCTIHQAIVQKLARTVSGLHAVETLLDRGLFQEQGVIQRTLDEIGEDITFLSLGIVRGELTQRHKDYLDYFYAEEFSDHSDVMASHESRAMVGRDKIRAYINQELGSDSARANVASKILTKAYSGFVHAASPHVMDMYGGFLPRFDITGESRTLRGEGYANDALNYFLRAMFSMAFASNAFGDEELFLKMRDESAKLEGKIEAHKNA